MILIVGGRGAIGFALRDRFDQIGIEYRVLVSRNKDQRDPLQLSLSDLKEKNLQFSTWVYIYTNHLATNHDYKIQALRFVYDLIQMEHNPPDQFIYFDSFYNQLDKKRCPYPHYSEVKKQELALLKERYPDATFTVLRLHQVVTSYKGLDRPGLIPTIIESVAKKQSPLLHSPEQKLRFLHIDNLLENIVLICEKRPKASEIIEVFSTHEIAIQKLVEELSLYIKTVYREVWSTNKDVESTSAKSFNFHLVGQEPSLNYDEHESNFKKIIQDLAKWGRESRKDG